MNESRRSTEYIFQGTMYFFRREKILCRYQFALQDAVKEFVTGVNRGLPLYKRMVPELSAQPLPRNAMGKLLRQ